MSTEKYRVITNQRNNNNKHKAQTINMATNSAWYWGRNIKWICKALKFV